MSKATEKQQQVGASPGPTAPPSVGGAPAPASATVATYALQQQQQQPATVAGYPAAAHYGGGYGVADPYGGAYAAAQDESSYTTQLILFIVGWFCSITWYVGALLPVCCSAPKPSIGSRTRCMWIANVVMSIISLICTVVLVSLVFTGTVRIRYVVYG